MSTRTIIEINHDYLGSLSIVETERALMRLLFELRGAMRPAEHPSFRVLGQRHHSEPEWKQERGNHG